MVMSVRIVVLGDGGVGKTALTIQLCLNHFIEAYDPTIEDSYRKHAIIDNQPCLLEILDTAGQGDFWSPLKPVKVPGFGHDIKSESDICFICSCEAEEYTALRDQWIREGEGFVLVYSITARSTFNRIERFRHQIVRVKDSELVPIVLVGNKADKVNEREVSKEDGAALAKRLGCEFVEASAKTRMNLEVAYYSVVRSIRAQREGVSGKPTKKPRKHRKCTVL